MSKRTYKKNLLSTHEMNCFRCKKDFFVEIDYNLNEIPMDKVVEIDIPCLFCARGLTLTLFGLKPSEYDTMVN